MSPETTHKRLQIVITEPDRFSEVALAQLHEIGEVQTGQYNHHELKQVITIADILFVRLAHRFDQELLSGAKRLKAIVTPTTGLNHIDLTAANSQTIAVLSLKGETEFLRTITPTAEHTWGLLLALRRNIVAANESVRNRKWDRDLFRGHDLRGTRLGILGLGRLGSMTARYGIAFEMDVAAYDPKPEQWVEGVTRCSTMEKLLQRSNILTIHVPLNENTSGLIGEKELKMLPKDALLINTSRGEVIDEEALVEILESGHIAGAALDTVCNELEPEKLWSGALMQYARTHDNLLITPHIGGATYESMERTELFMVEKLKQYLTTAKII